MKNIIVVTLLFFAGCSSLTDSVWKNLSTAGINYVEKVALKAVATSLEGKSIDWKADLLGGGISAVRSLQASGQPLSKEVIAKVVEYSVPEPSYRPIVTAAIAETIRAALDKQMNKDAAILIATDALDKAIEVFRIKRNINVKRP